MAAHQLRTPLSAVKWTLKMFQEGDLGPISKEQENVITKTIVSNDRMIRLVNDLLNVARIEEGKYITNQAPGDIEQVIARVVQGLREEAMRRKVKLLFIPSSEKLPQVLIDQEKIQLALENLIGNAIHYTPEQGTVTVLARNGIQGVEVTVSDTGIGIPKLQQDRVFSKFFRAGNAKKKETEGTGLGLYLAKNIIIAHKGTISFISKEDKGTTFTFTVPTA